MTLLLAALLTALAAAPAASAQSVAPAPPGALHPNESSADSTSSLADWKSSLGEPSSTSDEIDGLVPHDDAANGRDDGAALPRPARYTVTIFEVRPLLGVIIVSSVVLIAAFAYVQAAQHREAAALDRR